jgi:hypothetical protein
MGDLKSPITADNLPVDLTDQRRALEPNEAYKYCATLQLTNEAFDQNAIEGKTVGFEVRALAQSIYGSALDS